MKYFSYDVFLSHSSKDKPAVRQLAHRLKDDGLRVWFDEWVIKPGDMIGLKIEQGLEEARTLVLVMSASAFASEWVSLERHTVLFRDPTNSHRRFIPLRLDDSEIKDTLKQFAYVDWRLRTDAEYERLLAACRPPAVEAEDVDEDEAKRRPIKILKGHKKSIWGVAVTPDGRLAVSGSRNKTIRVWDVDKGESLATLVGHKGKVTAVSVTPDGKRAISGSDDTTVKVWDLTSWKVLLTLEGHAASVLGVSISADGQRAVSACADNTIKVWNLASGQCDATLEGHTEGVVSIAITADGRLAISGSFDKTVRLWNLETMECDSVLEGHTGAVTSVTVTADGRRAVSGAEDSTLRVWDLEYGRCEGTLEGHTQGVLGVAVTADARRAVSGSRDKTLRVWDVATGKCLAVLQDHINAVWGVAITADGSRAISGSHDRTVRVWDLSAVGLPAESAEETRYTNAKVLLVGDSGVGKSGLALRLTEDRFEPTISTDAVWATQIKLPHSSNGNDTEREIWLWDFAGQADYRLIHQLYMDETALAVLVFNPQSENPFEGLAQWDRDLQRAARRPFRKLLVAGRCDRGGLMISRESIESFRQESKFAQYLETSAYTGTGCAELRKAIVENISWENIPWTTSPHTFKVLKDEIIKLKDEGKVLLRVIELKQQLELRLPDEQFTVEELQAVVGLLAGPGIVWRLEFGDFIILQPERINAYAAAVIRTVRANTDEIGYIREEDVLAGKLDFQDMKRLPADEESIVLRAMHQTFVDHGLCLREHSEAGTLLIFPSYFKRERPELEDHPAAFTTYKFGGALDEIYATLVVRLHHTPAFEKDRLWRFAADFKTQAGKRAGLKMVKKREGTAEITVYFEKGIPDDTKVTFIKYIHDHLKAKDPDVIRLRHYVCPQPDCGEPVEGNRAVQKALDHGEKDIPCQFCRKPIPLLDLIEEKFASVEFQRRVKELDLQAGINIDNESRELILIGHAFSIAGEAGQIFRPTPNSDWGIDGEIEFKNDKGEASGERVYLQLKSGDSYLYRRARDGSEIFTIKNPRHIEYWQAHKYPVMLVVRTSDGQIRWMNVTDYLRGQQDITAQITFKGEPFTASNLIRMRDDVTRVGVMS